MSFRKRLLPISVLLFIAVGCAEVESTDSGVLPGQGGTGVAGVPDALQGEARFFPDVQMEEENEAADAVVGSVQDGEASDDGGNTEEDSKGDGSAGEDSIEVTEDTSVPSDANEGNPQEDGSSIEDAGGPAENDVEEETEDPPGPAEVGEPCTLEYGCVTGASCIEKEDGGVELFCYEDVLEGLPCGPGFGKCVDGLSCLTTDGQAICTEPAAIGDSCEDDGSICAVGTVCAPSGTSDGFSDALSVWSTGVVNAGTMTYAYELGHLFVGEPTSGAIQVVEGATGELVSTLELPGPNAGVTGLFWIEGTLWVANAVGGQVYRASAPGYVFESISLDFPCTEGPWDVVAVGPKTGPTIFVTCPGDNQIRETNLAGTGVNVFGEETLQIPRGMVPWGGGLWTANPVKGQIAVFAFDGELLLEYGSPATEAELGAPVDVAMSDSGDYILVADPEGGSAPVLDFDGALFDSLNASLDGAPQSAATTKDGDINWILWTGGWISRHEAEFGFTCVVPSALGEPCDGAAPPCAAGLTCTENTESSGESICLGVISTGGACGQPNFVCEEGTVCVEGDAASGHGSTCLPAVAIGEPCGPGIAGCAPGGGCNWDSPAHLERLCYPNVSEGGVCNGYGTGDCEEGTTCSLKIPGGTTLECRADLGVGADCGPLGDGNCSPELSCNFATSISDRQCVPFQQEGEICGIGVGECTTETFCSFETETSLYPICIGNSEDGELCATVGKGLCEEDAECVFLAAGGSSVCLEKTGQDGSQCGGFGINPCVDGTQCLIDTPAATSATCYSDQTSVGAPCGVGFGDCDAALGLACEIQDAVNLAGECVPSAPDYAPCGSFAEGSPGCGLLTHSCTCSSPFVPMEEYDPAMCVGAGLSEVCVPEVGLYDFCAVNTVLTGLHAEPGWIGMCPGDLVCTGSVGVNTAGQPITAEGENIPTLFFQCKPEAGIGEPCGQLNTCEVGLICDCGANTACTIFESMQGNQGTCQPEL